MAPGELDHPVRHHPFGGNTPRAVKPKVTAGLMCSPDSGLQAYIMAIATAPGAITAAARLIGPPPT